MKMLPDIEKFMASRVRRMRLYGQYLEIARREGEIALVRRYARLIGVNYRAALAAQEALEQIGREVKSGCETIVIKDIPPLSAVHKSGGNCQCMLCLAYGFFA